MTYNDSNSIQSWKRPWSPEEIVSSSQYWSLAADSGVCELLKSFSTDLLNEVSQLNNNVNELSIESKRTDVLMQNTFNDFCMLANNQFMENLVDVSSCSVPGDVMVDNVSETTSNMEDKLALVIPQVTESLRMGMQVLETQFEILDDRQPSSVSPIGDDISQLDSCHIEPVWQPKDPYEQRHLPHLIGTPAFKEDDTLGIGLLDDMDDMNELEDDSLASNVGRGKDGLSEEESDSEEDYSDEDDMGNNIDNGNKVANGTQPSGRNITQEDDIFADNRSNNSDLDLFDDDVVTSTRSKKAEEGPPDQRLSLTDALHNQLKEKLGITADKRASAPPVSAASTSTKVESESPKISDSKSQQLPGGSTNINSMNNFNKSLSKFPEDDEEEDDDLFGDLPKSSMKSTKTKPVISSTQSTDNKPQENLSKSIPVSAAPSKPITNTLSDSDEELFGNLASKPPAKKPISVAPITKNQSPANFLDEDSDDDLFASKVTKNPAEPKTPIKSVVVPAKTQPDKNVSKEKQDNKKINSKPLGFLMSNDDDDDDDIFQPAASKTKNIVNNKNPSQVPSKINQVSTKDSVDHFNESENTSQTPASSTIDKRKDDITKKEDKFIKVEKIEDDDDDDDIFISDKMKTTISANNKNPYPSQEPPKINQISTNDPLSLTIENGSKTNTSTPPVMDKSKDEKPAEVEKIKDEDDDDIFNLAPNKTNSSFSNKNSSQRPSKISQKFTEDPLNLFGDDNETRTSITSKKINTDNQKVVENSLSSKNVNLTNESIKQPAKLPKKSMSEDTDDDLFFDKPPKKSDVKTVTSAKQDESGNMNNAGSSNLQTSPISSRKSISESESKIETPVSQERPSKIKLPPGAVQIFNPSMIDQLKSKNKIQSQTVTVEVDSNENKVTTTEPVKTEKFKEKLNESLSGFNPLHIPPIKSKQPATEDFNKENEIDFETPAKEVGQLTLLTKSRPKNTAARRRPTVKKVEETTKGTVDAIETPDNINPVPFEPPKLEEEPDIPEKVVPTTVPQPLPTNSDDIFANLPSRPEKKSKINKKSSTNKTAKTSEVNVSEIDDIFAIPTSKSSSKKNKTKTKPLVIDDPLGAM